MSRSNKGEASMDEEKNEHEADSWGEHEDAPVDELPGNNVAIGGNAGESPSWTPSWEPQPSASVASSSASRAAKEKSKLAQAQQPSMVGSDMIAEPGENLFFNRNMATAKEEEEADIVGGTEPPEPSLPSSPGISRVPYNSDSHNNNKYDAKKRAAGVGATASHTYSHSVVAANEATTMPAYEARSAAAAQDSTSYDAAYGEPVVAVAVEGWTHTDAAPEMKALDDDKEAPPPSALVSDKNGGKKRIIWIVAGVILLLAIILGISIPLAKRNRDDNANGATPPPSKSDSCEFVLDLVTDSFGAETSWDLVDQSTLEVLAKAPEGTYDNDKIYAKAVLIDDGTYQFTIYDSVSAGNGDGIQPPGSYTISLNGKELATGGAFADSEATIFKATDCSSVPPSAPTPIITLPPVAAPTEAPVAAPVEVPTAAPTIAPAATPVATPTDPPASPTPPPVAPTPPPVSPTLPPVAPTLPPVPASTPPPTTTPVKAPTPAPVKAATPAPAAAAPVEQPTGGGQPVEYYDNSSQYYYDYQQTRRRRLRRFFS